MRRRGFFGWVLDRGLSVESLMGNAGEKKPPRPRGDAAGSGPGVRRRGGYSGGSLTAPKLPMMEPNVMQLGPVLALWQLSKPASTPVPLICRGSIQ